MDNDQEVGITEIMLLGKKYDLATLQDTNALSAVIDTIPPTMCRIAAFALLVKIMNLITEMKNEDLI